MEQAYWIWYPGDMELYFALKQNFSRVERGYGWPAFWKSDGFRNRVVFRRSYKLDRETCFTVLSKSTGYVLVDEKKYPFGTEITCPTGEHRVSIHAARIDAFPSVYIVGDSIRSDPGWMTEDYASSPAPAGYSLYFTEPDQDTTEWPYNKCVYEPVSVTAAEDGCLYEFETELTAVLEVGTPFEPGLRVYCGESREEALDREHCYYSWQPDADTGRCPCCALRFAFISGERVSLRAVHQFVDIPVKAMFESGDERLNRIWQVAEHTFRLCSGVFFIDGVKRDKWIWSGDAYQSLFVNRYLLSDPDIERRTLLALRGNDPMTTHINTIVDYSMLWLLAVKRHTDVFGDPGFLRLIWPKCRSLMAFLESQLDAEGFLVGREDDWIFIDWAELDKTAPFAAEQMLLYACYEAMGQLSGTLRENAAPWIEKQLRLYEQIQTRFWDAEKGAFLDSFTSGLRHVSRQTNLFALRFGLCEQEQKTQILQNVILNDAISAITTPYFAFFELDALGEAGMTDALYRRMDAYWGGMLDRGAVTFWEEFDETVPENEQYDMYGDKFGKSLCHAWAASPLYLIGRYLVGLADTAEGFTLAPCFSLLPEHLTVTLPVDGGAHRVTLIRDGESFTAETDSVNGTLSINGKLLAMKPRTRYTGAAKS
mgnify:CR=1 FL=1